MAGRLASGTIALLLASSVASCWYVSEEESTLPAYCIAGFLPDSVGPTKEAFYREVLFAAATPFTPQFDDYGPQGYYVDKVQLALELPETAEHCGLHLDALVIVGPEGPIWAYTIVVFLRDTGGLRVNSLYYPHARIRGKGTRLIEGQAALDWFDELVRFPNVEYGLPEWAASARDDRSREFSYDFLAARWRPGKTRYWHANFRAMEDVDELEEHFRQLLEPMLSTYVHAHR